MWLKKIYNMDETEVFLGEWGGSLTKPNSQITKDNAKIGNRKANAFEHRSYKLKPSFLLTRKRLRSKFIKIP